MQFFVKLKKRLIGSNNNKAPQEEAENDVVIQELENTMIDANERIAKMVKEVYAMEGIK